MKKEESSLLKWKEDSARLINKLAREQEAEDCVIDLRRVRKISAKAILQLKRDLIEGRKHSKKVIAKEINNLARKQGIDTHLIDLRKVKRILFYNLLVLRDELLERKL